MRPTGVFTLPEPPGLTLTLAPGALTWVAPLLLSVRTWVVGALTAVPCLLATAVVPGAFTTAPLLFAATLVPGASTLVLVWPPALVVVDTLVPAAFTWVLLPLGLEVVFTLVAGALTAVVELCGMAAGKAQSCGATQQACPAEELLLIIPGQHR